MSTLGHTGRGVHSQRPGSDSALYTWCALSSLPRSTPLPVISHSSASLIHTAWPLWETEIDYGGRESQAEEKACGKASKQKLSCQLCVYECTRTHVCAVRVRKRKSRGVRSEWWHCLGRNREILWELSNVIKDSERFHQGDLSEWLLSGIMVLGVWHLEGWAE